MPSQIVVVTYIYIYIYNYTLHKMILQNHFKNIHVFDEISATKIAPSCTLRFMVLKD